jgi:hypothetical protein
LPDGQRGLLALPDVLDAPVLHASPRVLRSFLDIARPCSAIAIRSGTRCCIACCGASPTASRMCWQRPPMPTPGG